MLVDEQVMPGVLTEEKPAEQGVTVPAEETEQTVKKTEEAVEKVKQVKEEESKNQEEEDAAKDETSRGTEKETEGVVLSETTLKAMDEEQEKEHAADGRESLASISQDGSVDSDDHTEKALSDNGSLQQRQSLNIDTTLPATKQEERHDTLAETVTVPITKELEEDLPEPQTPTTPDNIRISNASMASVPLSETDMSYDHLSAEQVEDFLATPRNHGSRHVRRPSSLEILQNSWDPVRQSTLFDANTPITPELVQQETMGAEKDATVVGQDRASAGKKSIASSIASTTRE